MVMGTIIVQARMSSQRLPGKVMKTIKDKTMLGHIITRLKQCRSVERIIISTSSSEEDDVICKEAASYGVDFFKGDLDNVLKRFYDAASIFKAMHIIRICADSPLTDPRLISNGIEFYSNNNYDYVSQHNVPLGLGYEIFSFEKLKEAYVNATENYQKEHVTPYIIENSNKGHVLNQINYSEYRLTVDTIEDFTHINEIYNRLYKGEHNFYLKEIINILHNEPELVEINKHIIQRAAKE